VGDYVVMRWEENHGYCVTKILERGGGRRPPDVVPTFGCRL
jgi:hypothetical protein